MDRDEVLATDVRIAELMDVGFRCTRNFTRRTLASALVAQSLFIVVSEHRLPHQTFLDSDDAVRSIVVVNGSLLSGPPTDNQHFHRCVTTNAMTPVVSFFKPKVWFKVARGNVNLRESLADIFDRRWSGLTLQPLDQFIEGKSDLFSKRRGNVFGFEQRRQVLDSRPDLLVKFIRQ